MAAAPVIMAVAAVAGAGVSAYGAAKSGQATYASSLYQAQVSERNQQIAAGNASNALAEGQVQEAQVRRQAAQTAGSQRASLAALGQVVGEGTAATIQNNTVQLAEADALQVRRNAERDALAFTLQGSQLGSDAVMQRQAGKSAATAGAISAAGSLLTGAGSAAYQYKTLKP